MDPKTFNEIYEAFAPKVYSYLKKKLTFSTADSGSASVDDVFQNVWLKVVLKEDLYDFRFTRAQWIYTLAHSCLIDYLRKQQRHLEVDSNSQPTEKSLENKISVSELIKDLNLNPEESKLLISKVFEEKEYSEMSIEFGFTEVNMRQKISRLFKKIRRKYES